MLKKMRDRLLEEVARKEDDLKFWTEDFPDTRFTESHDGGPLKDVTEKRISDLRHRIQRDKALLDQVEKLLRNHE